MARKSATKAAPLASTSVLRGLYALVQLGSAELEGAEHDWLGPSGTFSDVSVADVDAAKAWLSRARAYHGLGHP